MAFSYYANIFPHYEAAVHHFGYSRSSGLAHARVSFDDVTVFRQHRFRRPHQKTAFSKSIVFKSLHSGERFRIALFSVIVFGVVVWTIAVSGAKQLRFRLKTDQCGRGLKNKMECLSSYFVRVGKNSTSKPIRRVNEHSNKGQSSTL